MSSRNGSILRVEKIADNGPGASRWDLVVLGDGYRADEIGRYRQDVDGVTNSIFSTAPFDRLRGAINVHRVDVASDESGAGDLCNRVERATFFGSRFCADRIERLLVADERVALDAALDAVPQMNAAIVVVNSTTYGGSGGVVPVFSLAEGAFEIALHEMGHSHFGLADEYPFLRDCQEEGHARYRGPEPVEPNVTATLEPLKWGHLVTPGAPVPTTRNANCDECDDQPNPVSDDTVGAFDGARYFRCGIFRPQYGCRMRALGSPFCAVCQETITRVLSPFLPPTVIPRKRRSARH
jgi:hypothetical protein